MCSCLWNETMKALLLIADPDLYSEHLPGSILISTELVHLYLALAAGCIDSVAAVGRTALADFGIQTHLQSCSSATCRVYLRPRSLPVADLQEVWEAVKSSDGSEIGGAQRC